jgi:hypothetical protein
MKATELRIGNLVYDKWANVAKVESIGMHENVRISTKDYEFESNKIYDLFSINLTEEWLLKFGFKLDMVNFNWNAAIGENEIGDFKLALRYSERIGWFFQSKCTVIKYVHQLQNLYFALTCEELEVK